MSVITLPAGLHVHQFGLGQKDYSLNFSSPDSGAQQTRVLGPPRWTSVLTLNLVVGPAQMAQWKVMLAQLRGKTNQLAVYDIKNPVPRGTLRSALMGLKVALPIGGTAMTVQAQRALVNTLRATEDMRNAAETGGAAAWTQFDDTANGILVTRTSMANPKGATTLVCKLTANAVTTVQRQVSQGAAVAIPDNAPVVASVYAKAAECTNMTVLVSAKNGTFPGARFNLGAGTFVGNGAAGFVITPAMLNVGGGWYRCDVGLDSIKSGGSTPAVNLQLVTAAGANYTPTSIGDGLFLWGAGFEPNVALADYNYQSVDLAGTTFDAIDYTQVGKTLTQGDWIQAGSGATRQLFMVTADATADASAQFVLGVEPPSRYLQPINTFATVDKPTCLMRRRDDGDIGWAATAAAEGSVTLSLIESWEQ